MLLISGIHFNHLWLDRSRRSTELPTWVTNGLGVNFYFGGTSLLIVVGVAMDTVQQIEVAAHHAPLRRLLSQERPYSWPQELVGKCQH